MLHLWTKAFDFITCKLTGIGGITVNRQDIDFIWLQGSPDNSRIKHAQRFELTRPILEHEKTAPELEDIFTQIKKILGNKFVPIQISLPDPLFTINRFEIDKLPATTKAQHDYIKWRFQKIFNRNDLVCDSQVLKARNGHSELMGIAIDSLWTDKFINLCHKTELHLERIDPAVTYLLNAFEVAINTEAETEAVLAITTNYWSLAVIDPFGQLLYFNAQWCNTSVSDRDDIVSGTIRQIKSVLDTDPLMALNRLIITGQHPLATDLAERFDAMMDGNPVILNLPEQINKQHVQPPLMLTPVNFATGVRL